MRTNLTFQKSDRDFQVWEYQVSHGNLLIRSPKGAAGTLPDTNLDLLFVGVDYMAVPRHLHGVELLAPSPDEVRRVETVIGKPTPMNHIMILVSERQRFPVVAVGFAASEKDWDIFESPIEHRSQFRAEP
ncbi:MAG TPA: hypothetical protein VFG04_00585 [Planctomycetaceae bacterium]|jgi:hypothetical protein|nr:hypothetical protein [Planctomycetaceae bacterium]